ncbi:MAG: glycosyltransferase family 2 protein [Gemmatimonadota bacterium]|nr:glycosyltransferase family 2 protein [Gemmatimonadota bacterium]
MPARENGGGDRPELSVVCPLYNEEESVVPLVDSVRAALEGAMSWELILVDDGSADGTVAAAVSCADDPRIRLIPLSRNYGQSTATQAGFDAARGRVIATMDGDLQNDPRDIPLLVDKLREGFDLVVGYRLARKDRLVTRKIPSRVANFLIRVVTGVPIIDNGCSLKVYRRELIELLGLYSDMHRFIPALAVGATGAQIAQVPVRHHPRLYGESKYGLARVWKVLTDLATVTTLRWFRERPLLLFAYGGIAAAVCGTAFAIGQLAATFEGLPGVVHSGAAAMFFGLSLYLFMVGFIAQVAMHELSEEFARVRSGGRAR